MSEAVVQPTAFSRRSFIYRKLIEQGARFSEINGAAMAMSFGDEQAEIEQARTLGLADISVQARTGFKGLGTAEWLTAQGIHLPEESNRAVRQTDGSLTARLAPAEILLLGDLEGQGDTVKRLQDAWQTAEIPPASPRGFPVPRQDSHAWFAITGQHAPAMFAKLCGVDLRAHKFLGGSVAQTSVARLSTIVIRHDLGNTLGYYALCDSASADYFWDCLMDAMIEFKGGPIGLAALRTMAAAKGE